MTGKKLDQEKHKRFLIRALVDINKSIGSKLAFKGGTAAMLFYDLKNVIYNKKINKIVYLFALF